MARRTPSGFVSLLLLLTACLLLAVSLPNVGAVVRAATADGIPGTFTAAQRSCVRHPGHESCSWTGTFRSADGTVLRETVTLHGSGGAPLGTGRRTAAVDVGNAGRVYGPDGSNEWVLTALLLLSGYGLLGWLARRHLMPPPLPKRTRPAS